MAEDSPVSPISAAEPPKVNPLKGAAGSTLKLAPAIRRPVTGATQSALKPGLKLPPKPGMAGTAGLKLPPKPGQLATSTLKLPTKPQIGAGLKLPAKPVIRKPGTAPTVSTLPPPVRPAEVKPAEAAPVPETPAAPAAAVENKPEVKPVAVDAGGVAKLPTVELKAVDRNEAAAPKAEEQPPLEALKSVTQKLKGITQQIPQQAILRKTGIIADSVMTDAQKQAAKSKTARISLSEAIGAAPVKNENAPMKTIRIKRPVEIPSAAKSAADPAPEASAENPEAKTPAAPEAATVTQRKTLKITRPGAGAVRPGGKFGIKRPGQTAAAPQAPAASDAAGEANAAAVPEIADIPDIPAVAPMPASASGDASADEGPAWLVSLSAIVQVAACIAIGALAWFLFENTQTVYF